MAAGRRLGGASRALSLEIEREEFFAPIADEM
jgi:hypothetical protein